MKEMEKVFDFNDFIECVGKAGHTYVMHFTDFFLFEHGLSEGMVSKATRPLLENVQVVH